MTQTEFQQEIAGLTPLFEPESLAIIGASNNPIKPSGQPLIALTQCGFKGKIYPVNPKHTTLLNLPCYPSLEEIPGKVDLAIIAVPAKMTIDALHQCVSKGVKGVIIFTSGFAEVGPAGNKLQQEITGIARESGIRICGPNCMGIFSSRNALMANFAVAELPDKVLIPDYLGFISQSGGFGTAIYQMVKEKGFGFSHFISTGNEADLEFSHYMGFIASDEFTRVIGGYLEGVKNGPGFLQAADMAISRDKPILLIKAGRSPAAAKAAASHTGALVGSDRVYNAVFKQKGIIRVESIEDYQIMLSVLANNKIPRGKRVAILATSGGSGVALVDKCCDYGLEIATLQDETKAKLDAILPDFASSANPVDITSAIFTRPGLLQECAEILVNDPNVDILISAYWAAHGDKSNLEQMVRITKRTEKAVFNVIWGPEDSTRESLKYLNDHLVPAAKEVDFAVRSLVSLADYYKFKSTRRQKPQLPSIPPNAREQVENILGGLPPGTKLTEYESKMILKCYGVLVTREELAATVEDALKSAKKIGYPVVMKILSPDILHKTDVGGVTLNVSSDEEVIVNYEKLIKNARLYNPNAKIKGILIQEMVEKGTEIIVGIGKDPVFGSTILTGLGGIFVEALEDVSLRVVPVSYLDAGEMLDELKGRKVLDGLRGNTPADRDALIKLIQRISCLAEDFPQISELDINPLMLYSKGKGYVAVDAMMVIA